MDVFLYVVLGLAVVIGLIVVVWRVASWPCPTWLGALVEMDNPLFKNHAAQRIIEHLGVAPGMKVLDCGCGPGRVTIPLAQAVGPAGEVTAFDLQQGMLDRVRAKAEAQQMANIRFVQGGAGAGKLEPNYFDRAILVTVLGEIPDRDAALREIFASLKPGGVLSITEIIADPHFQRRATTRRLATAVGFSETAFLGNCISYAINFTKPGGE